MAGFRCSCCGEPHDGLPFSYGTIAPAYLSDELRGSRGSVIGDEQCVIEGEHFFVKARVVLPVLDAVEDFEWGVWVSLSEVNFARMGDLWTDPERVNEPPYFGWLSTDLPLYEPTTLSLATNVHSQAVGARPLVELEPTDHPLALEQRTVVRVLAAHAQRTGARRCENPHKRCRRSGAFGGAALDAELVPLGVAHDDPSGAVGAALVVVHDGADRLQPGDLLVAGALGRLQVEVDAVLHLLLVRVLLEEQRQAVVGGDQRARVPGEVVVLEAAADHLGPERAERVRILGVERDVPDA